ncbi:hypothetical protein AAG570_005151 [Ranatra chinensis]|uniref:Uncharacterized protein n=1 Tax=Ranatra chinensis TaxID=642074 RepID=A0ABD0XZL1_9HEMI
MMLSWRVRDASRRRQFGIYVIDHQSAVTRAQPMIYHLNSIFFSCELPGQKSVRCLPPTRPMTDEMMQMAQMLHNSCVEETGVQEDLIQKATKGSFTEDPKLKCYMKCIYTEMGGISEDGELDAEAIAAVLPDEVHEAGTKMINSCKDTKGDDTCDMAYKFNVCMHAVDPKLDWLLCIHTRSPTAALVVEGNACFDCLTAVLGIQFLFEYGASPRPVVRPSAPFFEESFTTVLKQRLPF